MTARRLLLDSTKKFPGWLALTVTLGFLSACISGVSITLVAPLVLELMGQHLDLNGAPGIFRQVAAIVDEMDATSRIVLTAGLLIALIGLKSAFAYLANLSSFQLTRLCAADLRSKVLAALMKTDIGYFAQTRLGLVVNLVGAQVDQSARILAVCSQLFAAVLTVAIYVLIMLWLSPPLTLVASLLFTLALFINNSIIQQSRELGKQSVQDGSKLSASLFQVFAGIRLVKTACAEDREQERLLRLSKQSTDTTFKVGAGSGAITPLTEFTGMVAIVAIIILGKVFFTIHGEGFSAVLLTFLFLLFRTLPQVSLINSRRAELATTLPNVQSLAAFLSVDAKDGLLNGTVPYRKLDRGISFQQVSFSYNNATEPILRGLNLFIPKGTSVAIVGESGAGKTTIADLLCRFYDPSAGTVEIDNRDLRDFDLTSLRSSIGVVSQEPYLFNESIQYNIGYFKPDANNDEIFNAAKRAHALDFIERLPKGFASPAGEGGAALSTGEKQRIAIARAILSDPDILILDEATSALDSLSEQIVQKALDELMQGRTTLVIAHRLSTVRKAGQIAVLENGVISEIGSHEDLIARNGQYRRMCEAGSVHVESK